MGRGCQAAGVTNDSFDLIGLVNSPVCFYGFNI